MKIRSRKPKEEEKPPEPKRDATWPFPYGNSPYDSAPPDIGDEYADLLDEVLERTTKGVFRRDLGWHVDFHTQCVYFDGKFVATIQNFKNDFTNEMIQSYHET